MLAVVCQHTVAQTPQNQRQFYFYLIDEDKPVSDQSIPSHTSQAPKPQFRNIHVTQIVRYRLPPAGYVSILHRVSGLALFFALPFLLCLFEKSILSENSFAVLANVFSSVWIKLLILGFAWAYLHHFCAGIRHLFMDVHIGLNKQSSCRSAIAVLSVSLFLTAVIAARLFGVF